MYKLGVTRDQLPNLKALADYIDGSYCRTRLGNKVVKTTGKKLGDYFDGTEEEEDDSQQQQIMRSDELMNLLIYVCQNPKKFFLMNLSLLVEYSMAINAYTKK